MVGIDSPEKFQEKGLNLTAKPGDHFFALVYPGPYRLGMANLGFQTILAVVYRLSGWRPERFFLDQGGRSLESRSDLGCFPVIGVSLGYECDVLPFLRMLENGRVPLFAEQRGLDEPLIIAGGAAPTLNPEIVAPFADIVIIGEGEETLPRVLTTWQDERDRFHCKSDLLFALSDIEGVYLPALVQPTESDGFVSRVPGYLPVRRKWVDLETQECRTFIYTSESHFRQTALVEMNRGCRYRCRFCAGSVIYRPLRNRSAGQIQSMIRSVAAFSQRVGFIGSDVLAHPWFSEALEEARKLRLATAFSSLSAQALWGQRKLLKRLAQGGVRTITLAPESGSEETRKFLGKTLANREWRELIAEILNTERMNVKLYFMLGKPWNQPEDDLDFLSDLIAHTRLPGKISVSFSFFVPKPHTPLADIRTVSYHQWKEERRRFERGLHQLGLSFSGESPRQAWTELILARADRRLAAELPRLVTSDSEWSWLTWKGVLERLGRDIWEWPRDPWAGKTRPWQVVETGGSDGPGCRSIQWTAEGGQY